MKKIFIKLTAFFFILSFPLALHGEVLQKDFSFTKQEVWRASLIALSSYPLEASNFDQGSIKTKVLIEEQSWKPIFRSPNSDYIYTIDLNIFDSDYGVRVSIDKELRRKANFNRNEQIVKTEKVEEDLILYRIQRELIIDRIIKKKFK